MAFTTSLTLLAQCFVLSGIIVAAADLNCSGAAAGFPSGKQTCTSSGPNYGKMCMKINVSGILVQGCDGSPLVPSLCELSGNAATCCTVPATGQQIICKASDFSTLVSAADFENCSAACQPVPGCFDDTAMFGQMPEPKCLFLLGQMSFGCDWTLSQIQKDCPSCPYNYTGKNMNTELGNLCKMSCGRCQSATTTSIGITASSSTTSARTITNAPATSTTTKTSSASATTTMTATKTHAATTTMTMGFMSGSIASIPSLMGIVLSVMVAVLA